MMIKKGGLDRKKWNTSDEAQDNKCITSRKSTESAKYGENPNSKRPNSSSSSQLPKSRYKTRTRSRTFDGSETLPSSDTGSENNLKRKTELISAKANSEKGMEAKTERTDIISVKSVPTEPTSLSSLFSTESKPGRSRRQSEIPIPKTSAKTHSFNSPNSSRTSSKLSTRSTGRETAVKKSKKDAYNLSGQDLKRCRSKKEDEEVVNVSLENNFTSLVPLYENELKKITDTWMNTIYCSLTMRMNLIKLLFKAFPNINRSQFKTEDEKLLTCIAYAKTYTKSEAESLIRLVRTLLASQQKAKEQYEQMLGSKEIAESYNFDWKKLSRKITETREEVKQLQEQCAELQKKKDADEMSQQEQIQCMEMDLTNKEEKLKNLVEQLTHLKEKETYFKGDAAAKNLGELRAEVLSRKGLGKEYQELKSKYSNQNEFYEKKIKNLELVLEEKKKILERERHMKNQIRYFMDHLQTQQNLLGKDQIDYVMRRSSVSAQKRRERLWTAAVKLVLRGFVIQMRKLEKDRNKMLLELQSSDLENFNALAANIIKKENFIQTVKHQMLDIYNTTK